MPQLSLYLDDQTMNTLRIAAQSEGVSMSKYAADLIRKREQLGTWPQGYWESVYGCLEDDSFTVGDEAALDSALDDSCDWFGGDDVPA